MDIETNQMIENKRVFSNMDEFELFYFPQQVAHSKDGKQFKYLDGVSLSDAILQSMTLLGHTKKQ
uniref:hypothetical protein n=1 Tax=Castellaniella defragrans TaxID=75697 RepID=UPI00333E3F7F